MDKTDKTKLALMNLRQIANTRQRSGLHVKAYDIVNLISKYTFIGKTPLTSLLIEEGLNTSNLIDDATRRKIIAEMEAQGYPLERSKENTSPIPGMVIVDLVSKYTTYSKTSTIVNFIENGYNTYPLSPAIRQRIDDELAKLP